MLTRKSFLQGVLASPLLLTIGNAAERPGNQAPAIRRPGNGFMSSLARLMDVAMVPGVGIGIVSGGRTTWTDHKGVANAETHAAIGEESLFPACSLGKPVFAYAVLRLFDEGRIDLDRPLAGYLGDDAPTGKYAAKVTARHVLSHTTGFVNWRQRPGEKLTSAFEPGSRFRYSGEGFYILQRCVEAITGVGFESFIQDTLFEPLGMHSSTYLWRADAETRVVAGHDSMRQAKTGFWQFNQKLYDRIASDRAPLSAWNHDRIVAEMAESTVPMPNGISPNVAFSLLTTVSDFCLFAARLAAPGGDALDLEPATRRLLQDSVVPINAALSWSLGIGIEVQEGEKYLWQWGDNGFWKDFLLVHPESRSATVVFTNGSNGMRIAERITDAASGRRHDAFLWV